METIVKETIEDTALYIQQDANKPPVIDKHALRKLLNAKPVHTPTELERVTVRCDRAEGKWAVIGPRGGTNRLLARAILTNVQFHSEYRPGGGCSGGYYIGSATGDLLPAETPVSVPASSVSGIDFYDDEGSFICRRNSMPLEGADYLILKDDCSAEVITPK